MQVLSYPLAKAMEWGLPTRSVTLFGKQWSLNPGRFSIKEHMAISIMANVSLSRQLPSCLVTYPLRLRR